METRARFVLIGLFTVLGFLAAFGFVLWLAKVQIDRTYEQYDLLFGSVSGLSPAATVTYNGINVGRVLTIALDEDDPSQVRVRIEIFASTPIRADTVGTLSSQGVTGVAYIALEGGSTDAGPLRVIPPAEVAVIPTQLSVVQDLMITAPDLVAEATKLIAQVQEFATPENSEAIAGILANLNDATGRINSLANRAEVTLSRVDAALVAAESSFSAVDGVLRQDIPAIFADLKSAVDSTTGAMDGIRSLSQGDLPKISGEVRALIGDAGTRMTALATSAEETLAAVKESFSTAEGLLGTDLPALIDGLTTAVKSATSAIDGLRGLTQGDLPRLSAQFGSLMGEASRLIATFDTLARRIGSDPGRFLLGNETPTYRRSQ